MSSAHIPVQLTDMIEALAPTAGDSVVDATFGGGGYSRALLEAADITLYGIDRDPAAQIRADAVKADFPGRFHFIAGRFAEMTSLLAEQGVHRVHAIVMDIGVSSFQIDQAERGFSFQVDGPLDMRMSARGESAADVVNQYGEDEIADILYLYGEERKSRRIAAAIVKARTDKPFERTRELAGLVERVLGRPRVKGGKKPVHPATRTFQALRIHVNDELGELTAALAAAEQILHPGGRLVVVTFHSLEDRIVKNFLFERAGFKGGGSRHRPLSVQQTPSFHLPRRSAVKPSEAECKANPRARSAKLRLGVRLDAPAWTTDLPPEKLISGNVRRQC